MITSGVVSSSDQITRVVSSSDQITRVVSSSDQITTRVVSSGEEEWSTLPMLSVGRGRGRPPVGKSQAQAQALGEAMLLSNKPKGRGRPPKAKQVESLTNNKQISTKNATKTDKQTNNQIELPRYSNKQHKSSLMQNFFSRKCTLSSPGEQTNILTNTNKHFDKYKPKQAF